DGCCILNLVILRHIPFPDQFSGGGLKAIKVMSLRTGGINLSTLDDRCSIRARFLARNKSPRRIIRFPRESPKQFSRCFLKAKNAAADLRMVQSRERGDDIPKFNYCWIVLVVQCAVQRRCRAVLGGQRGT